MPTATGASSNSRRRQTIPPFITAEIDQATSQSDELTWKHIPFTLEKQASIEVRATSGDAELWLDRVIFVPQTAAPR